MAIRTDQYTNTLSVVDTVNANASLSLIPQGTGSISMPGTGQNFLLQSNTFSNVAWIKNTVTLTGSQPDPFGGSTATKVDATGGDSYLYQAYTVATGLTYTFSVYLRADTNTSLLIRLYDTLSALSTDVSVTATTSWQRFSVTRTVGSGTTEWAIIGSLGTLTTGETIYAYGTQVEIGSVANTYIPTTTSAIYGTPSLSFSGVSGLGLQSDGSLYASSAGTGNVRLYTNNVAQEQARISHTASAVNYVNLTGGATTVAPTISAQGSDANIVLRLGGKGSGTVDFSSNGNPYALQVVGVASGANYNSWRATSGAGGSGASSAPVMSTWGIDTNISAVLQSKGTGAIDLAAGSAGVNISNGTTVTAITLTSGGSGYTSVPSVTISAPTTAGGVQATAQALVYVWSNPITSAGTGYTVGNTLTAVGGTGTPYSFTVSTINGSGGVTGVSIVGYGAYTVTPTNPVTFTGGSGSGFTSNMSWIVGTPVTITNAGSGYVEQPTVTFSGGGTGLAAAFATIGSNTAIRTQGNYASFYSSNSGSESLRLYGNDVSGGQYQQTAGPGMFILPPQSGFGALRLGSVVGFHSLWVQSGSDIAFTTGANGTVGAGFRQLQVSNTASAVNYLQSTGGATGSGPTISAQGSDTNADLNFTTKGSGAAYFRSGNGIIAKIADAGTTVTAYPTLSASQYDRAYYGVDGSATNITQQYNTKGTGGHEFHTGINLRQFAIPNTASAVNYVFITGGSTTNNASISTAGSDTNVGLTFQTKAAGSYAFITGGGRQIDVLNVNSAVNRMTFVGSATGFGPVLSAAGSDTNIPLVLQPKGTGALQAQQTDSTITGGNVRGANSVDWQTTRGAAFQVASSQYSVISGGYQNTASGFASNVSGGGANLSQGNFNVIGGGLGNTANSNFASSFSAIVSGQSNTANGFYNFVGAGFTNSGTSASAVTSQSATTNATTAVTLSASNASIKVGQYIAGTYISGDTYVAAISGTSLTLSQAASGSSTSTLSFYTPHGVVVGGGNNQATGSYSFIGGGGDAGTAAQRNTASGDWSVVVGGRNNVASGYASFVGGGGSTGDNNANGNQATAAGAVVIGGTGGRATGTYAVVLGGQSNTANSGYSTIGVGQYGTTRSIEGYFGFASNLPLGYTVGAAQGGVLILGKQTTDATATVLVANQGSASTTNQVILPNNSAYYFRGEVVSGVTGGGNTKGWTIEGVIKRGANAASTALVGTPTVTSTYADAGASTWAIAVTADTTNGGLAVTFTGQLATTIRVVAQIRTTEMTF